ncbi:MAG: penicillin-binding protein 2 [SAR324 cluster bacterium]|nr:penicillin-binding protein 2 [SAR324 cluster bacterium]
MSRLTTFTLLTFQSRLLSVMGIIGLGFVVIIGRLFYVQIYQHTAYEERARRQYERTIAIEAQRGTIYDRRGNMLAVSVPVNSLFANPRNIDSPRVIAKSLAPLLSMANHELMQKLDSDRSFVWLQRQMHPGIAEKIEDMNIKGLGMMQEFRRYYPAQELAASLIGMTGVDSQGLGGIEYEYNKILHGKKVVYVVEKDGTRRTIPSSEPEDSGLPNQYSLHLTLDRSIQFFADTALKQGVLEAKAQRGIAIVMHSATGAILAMSTYPGFDPNNYQEYHSSFYLNLAVSAGYEPGSTIKPVTLATALEEGIIQPDQQFYCEKGMFRIANVVIHDTSSHAKMNLREIMQKSSNICAAKIGLMIPREKFHQYLQRFNFGMKTNIGVSGEATGKLLAPKKWTEVDQASISFGHGILVSPLQLISALNVFATGGIWIPPYVADYVKNRDGDVLKEIRDKDNRTLYQFGARPPHRVISQRTAEMVKDFMVAVTEKGGTAPKAAIKGYQVAGKTGTSQVFDEKTGRYSREKHIAIFGGFVPASSPVLSILVVLEHPRTSPYGGIVAAPVFHQIAKKSLVLMDVLPTGMTTQNQPLSNGEPTRSR